MAELDYELEGCRTCGVFSPLQCNYLRQLFERDRDLENILELLRSWNIQVEINDGLPQYICTQCIVQLSETYKVQKSCLQVQEELRSWYFREKPGVLIKKEIEEDLNNHDEKENDVLSMPTDDYHLQNAAEIRDAVAETLIVNDANNISEMSKISLKEDQENYSLIEEVEIEHENQEGFFHEEFENEAQHDTFYTQNTNELEILLNRAEHLAESSLEKDYNSFSFLNSERTDFVVDDHDNDDDNDQTNGAKHNFKCHLCTKFFSLQFSLNRHMKRHRTS